MEEIKKPIGFGGWFLVIFLLIFYIYVYVAPIYLNGIFSNPNETLSTMPNFLFFIATIFYFLSLIGILYRRHSTYIAIYFLLFFLTAFNVTLIGYYLHSAEGLIWWIIKFPLINSLIALYIYKSKRVKNTLHYY